MMHEDEYEAKYEEPVIEKRIVGFSGIDPDRKVTVELIEEALIERINLITEISCGGE